MNRRQDRIDKIRQNLTDLEQLLERPWTDLLVWLAVKGYPTGNTGPGQANSISRPTEQAATGPDDPPAQKHKRLQHLERELDRIAREINSIRTWTTTAAKYDGPEPRPCIVLDCDRDITMIGHDIARNGRCPRCAQHYRRHHLEYPNKP